MTAYALSGLVDAEAHGYRVDAGRRERALQALADDDLDYPRAEPELKVYMTWVLGRALGERAEVRSTATARRAPGRARPRSTTCGTRAVARCRPTATPC